jgi:hypothetical protein
VHPALQEAAVAVRRDLGVRRADDALLDAVEHRAWWLAQWEDGAPHVLGLLAQDVQEAVHEADDPLWPPCPEHRDHPLFVEPDLGPDPFWVCHRTGLPVAPVGLLPEG